LETAVAGRQTQGKKFVLEFISQSADFASAVYIENFRLEHAVKLTVPVKGDHTDLVRIAVNLD
jgi:hypothetical protein